MVVGLRQLCQHKIWHIRNSLERESIEHNASIIGDNNKNGRGAVGMARAAAYTRSIETLAS